jgi:hypothetical protein
MCVILLLMVQIFIIYLFELMLDWCAVIHNSFCDSVNRASLSVRITFYLICQLSGDSFFALLFFIDK